MQLEAECRNDPSACEHRVSEMNKYVHASAPEVPR